MENKLKNNLNRLGESFANAAQSAIKTVAADPDIVKAAASSRSTQTRNVVNPQIKAITQNSQEPLKRRWIGQQSWKYKPDGTRKTFAELTTPEVFTWISTLDRDKQAGAVGQFYTEHLNNPGSVRYDPYYTTGSNNAEGRELFGVEIFDQAWIDANRAYNNYLTWSGEKYTSPKAPGKTASELEKTAYQYWLIANTYEQTTRAAEEEYAQLREEIAEEIKIRQAMGDGATAQDILDGIDWSEYKTLQNLREASAAGNGRYLNRPVQVGNASLTAMVNAALRGEDITEAKDYIENEVKWILSGGARAQTAAGSQSNAGGVDELTSVTSTASTNWPAAETQTGADEQRSWWEKGLSTVSSILPGNRMTDRVTEKAMDALSQGRVDRGTEEATEEDESIPRWLTLSADELQVIVDRGLLDPVQRKKYEDRIEQLRALAKDSAEIGKGAAAPARQEADDERRNYAEEAEAEAAVRAQINALVNAGRLEEAEALARTLEPETKPEEQKSVREEVYAWVDQEIEEFGLTIAAQDIRNELNTLSDRVASGSVTEEAVREERLALLSALDDIQAEQDERKRLEDEYYWQKWDEVAQSGGSGVTRNFFYNYWIGRDITDSDHIPLEDLPEFYENPDAYREEHGIDKHEAMGVAVKTAADMINTAVDVNFGWMENAAYDILRILPDNAGKSREEIYAGSDILKALRAINGAHEAPVMDKALEEYMQNEHPALMAFSMLATEYYRMKKLSGRGAALAGGLGSVLNKVPLLNTLLSSKWGDRIFNYAIGTIPFNISIYSQTVDEAREAGANDDQAMWAGIYTGLASGWLANLSVTALGKTGGLIWKGAARIWNSTIGRRALTTGATVVAKKGLSNAVWSIARNLGLSFLSEGLEEAAEEPISSGIAKWIYDPDRAWTGKGGVFDEQKMLQSGIMGGIMGVVFSLVGGASGVFGEAIQIMAEDMIQRAADGEAITQSEVETLTSMETREAEIQDVTSDLMAQRQPEIDAAGEKAQAAMETAQKAGEKAEAAQAELNTRREEAQPLIRAINDGTASYEDPEVIKELGERHTAFKAAEEGLTAANTELAGAQTEAAEAALEAQQTIDAIKQESRTTAAAQVDTQIAEERAQEAQAAAEARQAAREEVLKQVAGPEKPGVNGLFQGEINESQSRQLRILDAIGRQYGVEIAVVDSLQGANGMYAGGRRVLVALDAIEQAYVQTAAHEMVHYIKQATPDGYELLRAEVEEALRSNDRGFDFDEAVRSRMAEYQAQGIDADEEYAIEEIIAEAVPTIFTDENVIRKIVDKDKSLGEKMRDFFAEFAQKLRDIAIEYANRYWNREAGTDRDEITALMDRAEELDKIADVFDQALEEAKGAEIKNVTENTTRQYGSEPYAVVLRDNSIIADSSENVNTRYSAGWKYATQEEYDKGRSDEYGRSLSEVIYDTGAEAQAAAEANRAQTETEEFRTWFEGSQVVNEDGSPKIMYHGSPKSSFTKFDVYGGRYGLMGKGSYFTDNPTVAEGYSHNPRHKDGKTPGVYPVYLRIRNPIDMDAKAGDELAAKWQEFFSEELGDTQLTGDMTNEEILRKVEEALMDAEALDYEAEEYFAQFYEKYGFDGITHIGGGRIGDGPKHRVYIAISEPEQIKSATGNQGLFDWAHPDIRYSLQSGSGSSGGNAEQLGQEAETLIEPEQAPRETADRRLTRQYASRLLRDYNSSAERGEVIRALDEMYEAYKDISDDANVVDFDSRVQDIAGRTARTIVERSARTDDDYGMDVDTAAADLSLRMQEEVLSWLNRKNDAAAARMAADELRETSRRREAQRREAMALRRTQEITEAAQAIREARASGDNLALRQALETYRSRLRGRLATRAEAIEIGVRIREGQEEIRRLNQRINALTDEINGDTLSPEYRDKAIAQRENIQYLRNLLRTELNALHRQQAITRAGADAVESAQEWAEEHDAEEQLNEVLDLDMTNAIDEMREEMRDRVQGLNERMRAKMPDYNMTSTLDVQDVVDTFADLDGEIQASTALAGRYAEQVEAEEFQLEEENTQLTRMRNQLKAAEASGEPGADLLRKQILEAEDRIKVIKSQIRRDRAQAQYYRRCGAVNTAKVLREGRIPQPIMERIIAMCSEAGRRGRFAMDGTVDAAINLWNTLRRNANALIDSAEALRLNFTTAARVWDDIFGEMAPLMRGIYYDPVMDAETERTAWIAKWRERIGALKLTKAESKLVQQVGEGKITLEEGVEAGAQARIGQAVALFREFYDEAHAKASQALVRNGYEEPGYIGNYFPHIEVAQGFFEKLGIPMENVALPTSINGLTESFSPGRQYSGHLQHREGDATDYNALAGFEEYIGSISSVIYHTDNIQRLRQLEAEIRAGADHGLFRGLENGSGREHLNEFVKWIHEYTNLLAGKKSALDRSTEAMSGRPSYRILNKLRSLKGANAVAANLSSAVTNMVPVSQVAGEHPVMFARAAYQMLMGNSIGRGNVTKSQFMIRRFGSDSVVRTIYSQLNHALSRPFEIVDAFATQLVVNTYYQANLDMGMDNDTAMRSADAKAARLMGDRSKGAMPTALNSQVVSFLTQFQYEVANQSQHFRKDLPRQYSTNKLTAVLLGTAVSGWLWNLLQERITGNRSAPDPIGMGIDMVEVWKETGSPMAVAQSMYNNVSEIFPYMSSGGRIAAFDPISTFAEAALTEGNSGWDVGLAFAELVFSYVPFGGQVKKTAQGIAALMEDGVYNANRTKLKYAVDTSDLYDNAKLKTAVQSILFGPGSTQAAVDYYSGDAPGLSKADTTAYRQSLDRGMTATEAYQNEVDKAAADKLVGDAKATDEEAAHAEGKREVGRNVDNVDNSQTDSQREEAAELRSKAVPGELIGDRYWALRNEPGIQNAVALWRRTGASWMMPEVYDEDTYFEMDLDDNKDTDKTPEYLTDEMIKWANAEYEARYMTLMGGIDPQALTDAQLTELEKRINKIKSDINDKLKEQLGRVRR